MAIKFIKGSLLDSQSQTLVCPVNCVGVMDEGLALSFKLAYPSMYERYKYYCDKSLLRPGMLWLYGSRRRKVLCFPTRLESEGQADSKELENIESGLAKFCATYKDKGITSVDMFIVLLCHATCVSRPSFSKIWALMLSVLRKALSIDVVT